MEEYKQDGCQEVNEKTEGTISCREAVQSVLTLSKSIAVKSQVPIQVLLEEERTEPERSPWEDTLPPSTYIILISASPIIGLTRPP